MSSMGDEVLVHLASEAAPGIEVAFIDTGYHFAETLGTADAYVLAPSAPSDRDPGADGRRARRPLRRTIAPPRSGPVLPTAQGRAAGAPLAGRDAWVTGMRRVDAPTRSDIEIIGGRQGTW